MAIIVNSPKCAVLAGRWPNVGEEVFKGMSPALADCNAAPAVSVITLGFRKVAARSHIVPCAEFFTPSGTGAMSVREPI
jgi:hypothetical protein